VTLPPTPKSQHYVWQHYLEAWATGGSIACYRQRERKAFRPGTKNIATETYFYRTHDLTERELAYLEATIAQRPNIAMHSNHRAFVAMFSMVSGLRRLIAQYGKDDPDARAQSQALLDHAERSLGESYQVAVENKGMPLLAALRAGDGSFWRNEDSACEFAHFIATQYIRTARMRNKVMGEVGKFGIDFARVWPVESHFWASEIGLALFGKSEQYRPVILSNTSGTPFITGDQPAINLTPKAGFMKLYYPVAPDRALLLTVEAAEQDRRVSALEAEHFNHAIYSWSDDQIYGLDVGYLSALATLTKSPTI
jgi:hypothetical protein